MKKFCFIVLMFLCSSLFAEAPELQQVCYHSWKKLTEYESSDFPTDEGSRIYLEKYEDFEILRRFTADNISKAFSQEYKNKKLSKNEYWNLEDNYITQELYIKSGDNIKLIGTCHFGFMNSYNIEFQDFYIRQRENGDLLVCEIDAVTGIDIDKKEETYDFKTLDNAHKSELYYFLIPRNFDINKTYSSNISIISYVFLFDSKYPLRYSLLSAFDGNPDTSYCVSKEQYDKSRMTIWFDDYKHLLLKDFDSNFKDSDERIKIRKMAIINGYAASMDLYKKNSRITYSSDDEVKLKDDYPYYQIFNTYENTWYYDLISEYPGSQYSDICVAEINFYDKKLGWLFGPVNEAGYTFHNEFIDRR